MSLAIPHPCTTSELASVHQCQHKSILLPTTAELCTCPTATTHLNDLWCLCNWVCAKLQSKILTNEPGELEPGTLNHTKIQKKWYPNKPNSLCLELLLILAMTLARRLPVHSAGDCSAMDPLAGKQSIARIVRPNSQGCHPNSVPYYLDYFKEACLQFAPTRNRPLRHHNELS